MEPFLLLVILGLVIYIVWPKKKKETSPRQSSSPHPAKEQEPIKTFTRIIDSPVQQSKNNFNLDLSTDEDSSGKEYLEEYYDVAGVHIATRKNYILNNCEEFEPVFLRKEPGNPVNPNAIAIYHDNRSSAISRTMNWTRFTSISIRFQRPASPK